MQWSYHSAAETRFGFHRLKSTAGVQQGDPLGPLLSSLVIMEIMEDIGDIPGITTKFWYLDDGTSRCARKQFPTYYKILLTRGPSSAFISTLTNSFKSFVLLATNSVRRLIPECDESTLLLMDLSC